MLEVSKEKKYKLKDSVTLKNILNEVFFILDSETGTQYDLTEMEYEIVSLIAAGLVFPEIAAQITSQYSASISQISIDLEEYYTSLLDAGIIVEA